MEISSTPEQRAIHFAGIATRKSGRTFLFIADHFGRSSSCGVMIQRRDGEIFQITAVSGVIEALDDESSKLGGQRMGEFAPISGGDDFPITWYGDYEFSAEKIEKRSS